jgi:hypothetical protein
MPFQQKVGTDLVEGLPGDPAGSNPFSTIVKQAKDACAPGLFLWGIAFVYEIAINIGITVRSVSMKMLLLMLENLTSAIHWRSVLGSSVCVCNYHCRPRPALLHFLLLAQVVSG